MSDTYPDNFTAQVHDTAGAIAARQYLLPIVNPLTPATAATLPQATVGVPYSTQIFWNGGTPPYAQSMIAEQAVGNSWALSSSGVLTPASGSPSTAETDNFTFLVIDAAGIPNAAQFNLTVVGGTPPPVTGAGYKVGSKYSGVVMGSINVDDWRKTGGANDKAEMNLLATGASTAGAVGYNPSYSISSLCRGANGLGTVQGDYSAFSDMDAEFAYLQSVAPGCFYCPAFQSDVNVTWTTYTGSGAHVFSNSVSPVPAYILNCGGSIKINNDYTGTTGTTTYALPVQANGQCGFAYSAWTGSSYIVAATALQEPAVAQDVINFRAAAANHLMPWPVASGGDGNLYPMNAHPLIPWIRYGNEISYNFGGSGPANYSGGTALTAVNFWTQVFRCENAAAAVWNRTPQWIDATYGVTGTSGAGDTVSAFNTASGYLARSVTSLGGIAGLPFIRGLTLCPSDTFGSHWTSHYNQNLGAQAQNSLQADYGVQTPTGQSGSTALAVPTNPSTAYQWGKVSQWQSPDYNGSTTATSHRFYTTATQASSAFANNALGVGQLIQAAVLPPPPGASLPAAFHSGINAQWILAWVCSEYRAGNPPTFGLNIADWGNYIWPTIAAASFNLNSAIPANVAQGATPFISVPNGFAGATSLFKASWEAAYVDSNAHIAVTPATNHQAGTAWMNQQIDVSKGFQLDVPLSLQVANPTTPSSQGVTVCVQNSNSTTNPPSDSTGFGTNAIGDSNQDGYGAYAPPVNPAGQAIGNSVAFKIDLSGGNGQNQYPSGVIPNEVGLYINGGSFGALLPELDVNPYGINFHAGNPLLARLVYDPAGVLTAYVQDTVTKKKFRGDFAVNLPTILTGNLAWIGVTGGTVVPAEQKWTGVVVTTGFNTRLATPTFSVTPGSYPTSQSVAISGPTGAAIYYRLDGLPATDADTPYTGALTIASSTIVTAVAVIPGFTDSFVAVGDYQIAPAATPHINFPSGFASAAGLIARTGATILSGSALQLCQASLTSQASAAWYKAARPTGSFVANFQIQYSSGAGASMAYVIQNPSLASAGTSVNQANGGPLLVNVNANMTDSAGYAGVTNGSGGGIAKILQSVAFKFDAGQNALGVYTNGATPTTPQTALGNGVVLNNGNPMDCQVNYNASTGTALVTVTDHNAPAKTFSTTLSVNIASICGATATFGFTAASGFGNAGIAVNSWTQ